MAFLDVILLLIVSQKVWILLHSWMNCAKTTMWIMMVFIFVLKEAY